MSTSVASPRYRLIDERDMVSTDGARLTVRQLLHAVETTNARLSMIRSYKRDDVNFFSIVDFRMLSGLIGEMVVLALDETVPTLRKNPHLDGYPDLCNVSTAAALAHFERSKADAAGLDAFRKFQYGGIEVKNTFGTKKSSHRDLIPPMRRVDAINKKLDWKAHHRQTNDLLSLVSDFVGGLPQVVAVFFANNLVEDDWSNKADPEPGSTMTSFSVIQASGCDKLKKGIRLCVDDDRYVALFDVEPRAWHKARVLEPS